MNFTDSRTCLVENELTCAGFNSEDQWSHDNCALEMDVDWYSSNSSSNNSSEASLSFSTGSPDRLFPSLPNSPPSPQDYSQQHHQQQQEQKQPEHHQQQCHQQKEQHQHHHEQPDIQHHENYHKKQHKHHHSQQNRQHQHSHHRHSHHHHHHHQQQRASRYSAFEWAGDQEVMTFHSAKGVWDSLAYITSLTDMCDVIFYVGKERHPVYGVKALLSVRSRVMYLTILQAQKSTSTSPKSNWRRLRHSGVDNNVRTDGRIHVDVMDYDGKVFSQLIGFLHSGRVTVNGDTVLGLYCAAAEYEVDDLRTACWDFVDRCAQRGHVHCLLMSGRPYLGRKYLDKLSHKFFKL